MGDDSKRLTLTDKRFKYSGAAATSKPDYLRKKWLRTFPGCFDKPVRKELDKKDGDAK